MNGGNVTTSMDFREWLERARDQVVRSARQFGLHARDLGVQTLRCPRCGREIVRLHLVPVHPWAGLRDIERALLAGLHVRHNERCDGCGAQGLWGDGARQTLLTCSEHERAVLEVDLWLDREDDTRAGVRFETRIVPIDADREDDTEQEPRLDAWWLDARLRARSAVRLHDEDTLRELRDLASNGDDPILLREYADACARADQSDLAGPILDRVLQMNPDDIVARRLAGVVALDVGDHARAADALGRVWVANSEVLLLPELMRAAYRDRRIGTLRAACREMLRTDSERFLPRLGLVCAGSLTDIDDWRTRLQQLHVASRDVGDRGMSQIVEHWLRLVELPLPDWTTDDADAFSARVRESLEEIGGKGVEDLALPLPGGGHWTPDLAMDVGAHRWVFLITESTCNVALEHSAIAIARAMLAAPEWAVCRFAVLSPHPLTWLVLRACSASADAVFELQADADVSLRMREENVATLAEGIRRRFGDELEPTFDSLESIDFVLRRLAAHGFGGTTWPMRCLLANWIAEVLRTRCPDAHWLDPETDDNRPPRFRLDEDTTLDLFGQIDLRLRERRRDPLHHWVMARFDTEDSDEP